MKGEAVTRWPPIRSRLAATLVTIGLLVSAAPGASASVADGSASASTATRAPAAAPHPDRAAAAVRSPELVPESVTRTDRVLIHWADIRPSRDTEAMAAGARGHMPAVSAASRRTARFVRTSGSGAAIYDLGAPLGPTATRLLSDLRRVPGVVSVEPDLWMTAEELPNDPLASQLWGLLGAGDGSPFGIDAASVWPTTTGAGVVVAVIDTGLVSHVDLVGQSVAGYDMISSVSVANDGNGRDANASDPGDACNGRSSSWHGTHVAGTIAALAGNSTGVFGGAPGVKIQPVRVLGTCGGFSSDVADGIRWAAGGTVSGVPPNATPARVLNLSLSGQSPDCVPDVGAAIADARSRGAVVVVAAGNLGSNAAGSSPANCPPATTVAAIDSAGLRATFSNYGVGVDVAGPGVGIISTVDAGTTVPTGPTYAAYNGTSMATPHVALTAALIAASEPSLGPAAIEAILGATTTPFGNSAADKRCQVVGCGSGVVNAGRASAELAGASPIVGGVAPAVRYPLPSASLAIAAVAVDRTNVSSAAVSIDGGPWAAMTASDGGYGGISEALAATITAPSTEGDHEVCVRATDSDAHTSDGEACATITVDAGPPTITAPVPATSQIDQHPLLDVTAAASDGVEVASAELSLDGGPWFGLGAADGAFDSAEEDLAGTVGGAITQLSAGNGPTCALLVDATVRCWGLNQDGQLGDGTDTDRLTPVAVSGLSSVASIAVGGYHACALLADTTVRCWGFNGAGALGNGTTTSSLVPVVVSGLTGVTALASQDQSVCALLSDTTVRCWGNNGNGELGDGTLTNRLTPVPVSGLSGVSAIAGGSFHACARLANGTARCWGFNAYGALGDGSTIDRKLPVTVSGLTGVASIEAGLYQTCALVAGATVKCWGLNNWGQVGDGTSTDRHTPVAVTGLTGVGSISIGGQHGCARIGDATARCWGNNVSGQLGDGTTIDRHSPVAVSGLSNVAVLEVGGGDTCALLGDATARCWGINMFGEVGDGTLTQRSHPVRVAGIGALAGGDHSLCTRATDTASHASDGADCTTLTVDTPTATLVAPASPTSATTLSWAVTFNEAVTGLTAADFTRSGTASGCVVGAPAGSGTTWTVAVTGCGSGTVALGLRAASVIDAAGNAGPPAAVGAATVTVDRVRPTTSVPSVTPRAGAALAGTAIPVTIGSTGADTGGSGIDRFELARSTDGGSVWTTLSSTLPTASFATTVPASGTVRFRFRAIDHAGNVGLWATGLVLTPRLIQQNNSLVHYTGSWATGTNVVYSGGTSRASSAAGAGATYTFTGRSIAWITTRAPNRGKVRIYVNGTLVATVDSTSATTSYRMVAWQKTYSTSAKRTVKLVVAGTTGRPRVDLDAFAVLS